MPLPPGRQRRSISRLDAIARAKKATEGIKVGRPLTYSPELCDRAVALGMVGKSWAAIAREFGISRKTLNEWERVYPEFSDALSRARVAAQGWWEDEIQKRRGAKHFQAQAVKSVMAAQFEDYREQRQGAAALEVLGDFFTAIAEAAERRKLPGDDAKPVGASSLSPADPGQQAAPVLLDVAAKGSK